MSHAKRKNAYHFGILAEYLACAYLWCKGYRILALRYRNPKGEIDILAKKKNDLIAIEVKARKDFAACSESISPYKQQKIIAAMQWLLAGRGKIAGLADASAHNIRFDAIWVVPWRWPQHIIDAWRT